MSQRSNITIPEYLRKQVDELIERGVTSTLTNAINTGLSMLVNEHKLQRWDDQAFSDYRASLFTIDSSGVLVSRTFSKDVILLCQDIPQLRRHLHVLFLKLVKGKFDKSAIRETTIKGLFVISVVINQNYLKIIVRKQGKQLIACRVGYTTQQL